MAETGSGQEKTEQPTSRKLQQARDEGQAPRSRELNTLVILLLGGAGLYIWGDNIVHALIIVMKEGFDIDRSHMYDHEMLPQYFWEAISKMIWPLTPFFLLMLLATLLSPLSTGGLIFSSKTLMPKLEKLDPIKGAKKIISWHGLVELFKALMKFVLVAVTGYLIYQYKIDEFLALGSETINKSLAHLGIELLWIFIILSSVLVLVALVDVPFQIWNFNKQQKMTMQEVKDENKDTEGNPEVKGKIRNTQREMALKRMMEAVPKADVVVTNPTHFSVALQYDQQRMGAPVVVALGMDTLALQIKQLAREHDVPILEAPLLARALYFNTELGDEVPAGLYVAVAQVLAYVYQFKQFQMYGGEEPSHPEIDEDNIPKEYRRNYE